MEWLVLLHVLSAMLGLGPAYAFPLMMRNHASAEQMKQTLDLVTRLEIFPKLFGTLAVVSGLLLFWVGSYGPFTQMWIIGSLAVYTVIEVIIIGFLQPAVKKWHQAFADSEQAAGTYSGTVSLSSLYARVRHLHLWACIVSLLLFALMVMKPQ
ncbi:DUF2269 family protein [Paenibacillus aurantiacus]|uniref:DUF2269 family protein n=1 Tax=Paenibacillus aurantiacus TaxID=1936118 RepID=A0ABV5KJC9_9BACL